MRTVIRYRSQLLFRKSYRPNRRNTIKTAPRLSLSFRPSQAVRNSAQPESRNALYEFLP